MLPECTGFSCTGATCWLGVPGAFNTAIAISVCRRPNMVYSCAVIAGKCAEFILIRKNKGRNGPEVIRQILYFRTIDQLLPLQYAAHQQADDDQNNGDFDEGEAFLLIFHGMLQNVVLAKTLQ